jgi:hypothetical protein
VSFRAEREKSRQREEEPRERPKREDALAPNGTHRKERARETDALHQIAYHAEETVLPSKSKQNTLIVHAFCADPPQSAQSTN